MVIITAEDVHAAANYSLKQLLPAFTDERVTYDEIPAGRKLFYKWLAHYLSKLVEQRLAMSQPKALTQVVLHNDRSTYVFGSDSLLG